MDELYTTAAAFAACLAILVLAFGVVGLLIIALTPKPKGEDRDETAVRLP